MPDAGTLAAELGTSLLVAVADGKIGDEEFDLLMQVVRQQRPQAQFEEVRRLCVQELERAAEVGQAAYLAELAQRLAGAGRHQALALAIGTTVSDQMVLPEETETLRRIAEAFDISVEQMTVIADAMDAGWIFEELSPSPYPDNEEPTDDTTRILERLGRFGWFDAMAGFRDDGFTVSGFGALALQYANPRATLLRLEHHPSDASVHFHVTDESDAGVDFVLLPHDRLDDLLTLVIGIQDDITLVTVESYVPRLMDTLDVYVGHGRGLHKLAR